MCKLRGKTITEDEAFIASPPSPLFSKKLLKCGAISTSQNIFINSFTFPIKGLGRNESLSQSKEASTCENYLYGPVP
jgi:hypothetical protein